MPSIFGSTFSAVCGQSAASHISNFVLTSFAAVEPSNDQRAWFHSLHNNISWRSMSVSETEFWGTVNCHGCSTKSTRGMRRPRWTIRSDPGQAVGREVSGVPANRVSSAVPATSTITVPSLKSCHWLLFALGTPLSWQYISLPASLLPPSPEKPQDKTGQGVSLSLTSK